MVTKSKRRRLLHCGLRTFLLAIALICVGLGLLAHEVGRARQQEAIVEQLRERHAIVLYDYHSEYDDAGEVGGYDPDRESPIPIWLRSLLGHDLLVKPQMVYCEDFRDDEFGMLSGLDSITILQLHMSPLTGEGLTQLAELAQLRSLSLIDTRVSDKSLSALSGIASLKHLDLSYTPISDTGLTQIQRFTQLTNLSLRGTKCSDEGLRYLEGLSNLTELDLTETDVSTVAVDRLREALPRCDIDYGFYFYDYESEEFRHSPTRPPVLKLEYSREDETPPSGASDDPPTRVHGGVI